MGLPLAPGGFKKIIEKGAWFPDCRHLASSFGSSSLATLATGAWPSQHGIVADTWYDPAMKKTVPASDEVLLTSTLAAEVAADPRARVWSISMDATKGGILMSGSGGRQFWMDDRGQFASLGETPSWLSTFNSQRNLESLHNQRWQAWSAKADAPPLRTLTWLPEKPQEFFNLYRASPYGQLAQFEFLSELITRERLGLSTNAFDFVSMIVGSTALLGYETGARSPLMQQMAVHVDRRIEALLAQLAKSPGEGNFALVVTGAHGVAPEPPGDLRSRMAVEGEDVAQAVERTMAATMGTHLEKYVYPFLYLDTSGYRDPEPLRLLAARRALQHPAVAGYYTAGGASSTHDDWVRRFRNSFHPVRSGDVMLSYRPEYVEEYGAQRGVSYGSLYNYDVRVPLGFYGPQFRAGVFEAPVESVDVAPTLARAMGVGAPASCVGRVLGEALAG